MLSITEAQARAVELLRRSGRFAAIAAGLIPEAQVIVAFKQEFGSKLDESRSSSRGPFAELGSPRHGGRINSCLSRRSRDRGSLC